MMTLLTDSSKTILVTNISDHLVLHDKFIFFKKQMKVQYFPLSSLPKRYSTFFIYNLILAYIEMGDCTSKRYRPPQEFKGQQEEPQPYQQQSQPKQEEKKAEPVAGIPMAVPEPVLKQIQEQKEAQKSEDKWLEQEKQKAMKDERPGHYRQLLFLVQEINHFYQHHDVDSAMKEIIKFQALMDRASKELGIGEEELLKHLADEYQIWDKQVKETQNASNLTVQPQQSQLPNVTQACSSERAQRNAHIVYPYNPKLIRQIKKEHELIIQSVANMQRQGWQESERSEGLVIYTRREEDDTAGALFEVDLDFPFEHFFIMVGSPNYYKDCLPFVKQSREEKKFARNCKVGYTLIDLPIISCRQSFFQALAYSRLRTHGEFFLTVVTLYQKLDLQQYLGYKVVDNEKYVQILYKYLVSRYIPVREGFGKLILTANVDFGMNYLPFFLKEFIIKTFVKEMLQKMKEGSKNFKGSGWEEQIRQDSDSFVFFKNELDTFLRQKEEKGKIVENSLSK